MKNICAGWRWVVALWLSVVLVACGGGGGSADSTPNAGNANSTSSAFGQAVALRLSPDLGPLVAANSTAELQVLAVNAKGDTLDVTDQVQVSAEVPSRLTSALKSTFSGPQLQLQFAPVTGNVALTVQALGLSLSKSVWVTSAVPPLAKIQGLSLNMLLPANADNSFSLLRASNWQIQTLVMYDGGTADVSQEALLTSSNPSVVSVDMGQAILGWMGHTLTPGSSTVRLKWAGYEVSKVIHVDQGLVLDAASTGQVGLTENLSGRNTVYFYDSTGPVTAQLAYVESPGANAWGSPVVLPAPASLSPILSGTLAAESPNGYRAAVTSNVWGAVWVHWIDPNGQVKGPVLVADESHGMGPLAIAVTAEGNAHVWLLDQGSVVRKLVRFSDLQVSAVNAVQVAAVPALPKIAIASDGTVGLAWTDTDCNIRFAFDNLANPAVLSASQVGTARISECDAQSFSGIFTSFDVAAGGGELAVAIMYAASFNTNVTEVMNVAKGGVATVSLLDHDRPVTAGGPRISMTSSGEFVAIWPSELYGIWAVHRPVGAPKPGVPFLVVGSTGTSATQAVEGVYSRGDGRFLLAWKAGSMAQVRSPVEMREYSLATGLGDRLSFPYQSSSASNSTTIIATPHGISAVWSFLADSGRDQVNAIQRFLP